MAINYQQKKNTNTVFGGTDGITIPNGSTSDSGTARPGAPNLGELRYNFTTGLPEFYTANGWTAVAAPPSVSTFSGVINVDNTTTLTVSGSNFVSGAVVYIGGAAVGGGTRALTTTFVNQTTLTANTNAASVNFVGAALYDITVINPSGLSSTLSNAGTVDRDPTWSTASGSLGTLYDSARSFSYQLSASDPDGATVSFSVVSGNLPSGLSLSSGGLISGTANAVGSDTTSTFTVRASSNSNTGGLTINVDRSFNITVKAPVIQSFTATGGSTFNVPVGVTSVNVLVVAGGGGGGGATGFEAGGGGGAGGYVTSSSFPVTPGGSVPVNVGSGGGPAPNGGGPSGPGTQFPGSSGGPSNFGPLSATGGGHGGGQYYWGAPGGSGGGQAGNSYGGLGPGTPGQGNPGGPNSSTAASGSTGSGGGGATSAGSSQGGTGPAPGGNGATWPVNGTTYAGGGGGGNSQSGNAGGSGGPGGGGNYNNPGATNRGGGGGGTTGGTSGSGGPGIVIVKY
jgi:hypothetical protein